MGLKGDSGILVVSWKEPGGSPGGVLDGGAVLVYRARHVLHLLSFSYSISILEGKVEV